MDGGAFTAVFEIVNAVRQRFGKKGEGGITGRRLNRLGLKVVLAAGAPSKRGSGRRGNHEKMRIVKGSQFKVHTNLGCGRVSMRANEEVHRRRMYDSAWGCCLLRIVVSALCQVRFWVRRFVQLVVCCTCVKSRTHAKTETTSTLAFTCLEGWN